MQFPRKEADTARGGLFLARTGFQLERKARLWFCLLRRFHCVHHSIVSPECTTSIPARTPGSYSSVWVNTQSAPGTSSDW